MPRDGAGVYTLPAGNPVVTNTVIASTWANTTLSDIAAQLNNVLTRDGLLGPTGPFKIVDGTVNAPGLAFNSEPGLGWYRESAGIVSMAVGGAKTFAFHTTAVDSYLVAGPRATGSGNLQMWHEPATNRVNTDYFLLTNNATGTTFASAVTGSGTKKLLQFDATKFAFNNVMEVDFALTVIGRSSNSAVVNLNKGTGTTENVLTGQSNGSMRWRMTLGDSAVGQDFYLQGYNDAGAFLTQPFLIRRADGIVNMAHGALIPTNNLGPNLNLGDRWIFSADANNKYAQFTDNWYWAFQKSNGNLWWQHGLGGPVTTFSVNGDFHSGLHLWAGPGTDLGLVQNGSFPYIRFSSDNWRLQFNRTNGDFQFINPSNAILSTLTAPGTLSVAGSLRAAVNVYNGGDQLSMQGNSFTVNTFGNSSGNIFSNALQGTPSGMYQCVSLQHQPGVSAGIVLQVGGSNFIHNSSGTAICSGGWTTSDRATKKNIVPLTDVATPLVMAIPVTEWDRLTKNEDGTELHQVGWVAQDVLPHFPKAVYEYDDIHALPALEGSDEPRLENRGKKLALDHGAMGAALWKAFQELQNRVVALETA